MSLVSNYERENFSHFRQVREWSTRAKTETNYRMHVISFLTEMLLVLGNTLDFLIYPILRLISMLFHMLLEEKALILWDRAIFVFP